MMSDEKSVRVVEHTSQPLVRVLNNEDEATATATNEEGVTIEVTFYEDVFSFRPFWIWQVAGLQEVCEDDVHLFLKYEELCQDLFEQYDLDADQPIWMRVG